MVPISVRTGASLLFFFWQVTTSVAFLLHSRPLNLQTTKGQSQLKDYMQRPNVRHQQFMQLSGNILRKQENDINSKEELTSARPFWLNELVSVKENGFLTAPFELRRVDWDEEDDEVVDSFLMSGKINEAKEYFEDKKLTSIPIYRQTLRYHWTQTENEIHVGVPVPKAVRGTGMHLIVADDALQMALIDDPSFGVISGKFAGEIDPANSGWQLVQRLDGSYSVSMTLRKVSQPGTHSLWYQLFQGETLATCLLFKSSTPEYHWQQDLDYMNVFLPIPEEVSRKSIDLVIDAGGKGMTLTYVNDAEGSTERVEGEFSGTVAPDESTWVIDEDEKGQRCICLSLRKRARATTESTWWSRFLKEEEEKLIPPEVQRLFEEGKSVVQRKKEKMEQILSGD